jgi:cobalt-zinc-cadmium efflux system protein
VNHDNNHDNKTSWCRRLIATMVMNLFIPAVQIYGGVLSGSMALISDAIHNLSDFTSVLMTYAALRIGRLGPTLRQTFGYKRAEVFATLLNTSLLYGAGFYIAVEAWHRFLEPQPVIGQLVVWIALFGFAGNAVSTLMLRTGAKANMNMKSAFLHMLIDALTSLAVAALGIIWIYEPWYWLDPVVSWIIVGMIFYSGWGLLKDTVLILMNATPPGIELEDLQKAIESVEGVKEIHHLHVWNTSPESISLAVHVTVTDQMLSSVDSIAYNVHDMLLRDFHIDHPILQFEANGCGLQGLLCCPSGLGQVEPESVPDAAAKQVSP